MTYNYSSSNLIKTTAAVLETPCGHDTMKGRFMMQPHSIPDLDSTQKTVKVCPICGKSFRVKPSHFHKRTYCSRTCMSVGYQDRMQGESNPNHKDAGRKVCPTCNKEFKSYNKSAIYCSMSCRARAPKQVERWQQVKHLGNEHKKKRAKYKQARFPLTFDRRIRYECQACGKVFYSTQKNRVACSKTCGSVVAAKKQEDRAVIICVVCGEPFEVPHSGTTYFHKVTCSRECLKENRRARQAGEKSHRWRGGKTSKSMLIRTSARYAEWRKQVFERDNYTCQLCGQRGGKLAAHHIKPFAKHQELRLRFENGITLCWSCHASIKGKEGQYENQFAAKTGL